MMLPTPDILIGQPPASTTSYDSSYPISPSKSLSVPFEADSAFRNPTYMPHGGISETDLEHPSGYIQNPYAFEMTPGQRLAMEQIHQPKTSQILGQSKSVEGNHRISEVDDGL